MPYHHPAILDVLAQFFQPSDKLFLEQKYHKYFEAPNGAPQLCDPMVAFVATAVRVSHILLDTTKHSQIHNSLAEWQTGSRVQIDFSANRFVSVFKSHINRLQAVVRESPKAYCRLMASLYSHAKYVIHLYFCCWC